MIYVALRGKNRLLSKVGLSSSKYMYSFTNVNDDAVRRENYLKENLTLKN